MSFDFILTSLFVFMLLGSVVAIETKSILSAVIAFGVVGFASSCAFMFLGAPDIAITQVVVEVLSLILLIRAVGRVDNMSIEKRVSSVVSIFALVFAGFFLSFSWFALKETNPFGYPSLRVAEHYLKYAIEEIKSANVVTAIILDYRAYDTLGEAVVLFTSILGAFTVLRKIGKKRGEKSNG